MTGPGRGKKLIGIVGAAGIAACVGCATVYYDTLEQMGWHKRDLLVQRVEAARDDQEAAKEQFRSALEQFSEVVGYEGGDLQAQYDALKTEYDESVARADAVRKRIASVDNVAEALFKEWEKELELYSNDDLRRKSERRLGETRERYADLLAAMRRAEGKMQPVLDRFQDQVLILKHNLNARAIASLEGTVDELESDVAQLVEELERSIAEANTFIASMGLE